jgi:hypothetical protein
MSALSGYATNWRESVGNPPFYSDPVALIQSIDFICWQVLNFFFRPIFVCLRADRRENAARAAAAKQNGIRSRWTSYMPGAV